MEEDGDGFARRVGLVEEREERGGPELHAEGGDLRRGGNGGDLREGDGEGVEGELKGEGLARDEGDKDVERRVVLSEGGTGVSKGLLRGKPGDGMRT